MDGRLLVQPFVQRQYADVEEHGERLRLMLKSLEISKTARKSCKETSRTRRQVLH